MQVSHIWCDNGNVNSNSSNANFPNVGGNYNNSAGNVGMFYCNVNVNSTNSNSNNGSRKSFNSSIHAPPTQVGSLYDPASRQNTTYTITRIGTPTEEIKGIGRCDFLNEGRVMKRIKQIDGLDLYDVIRSYDNITNALYDSCRNHSKNHTVRRIKENPGPYVDELKRILDDESFHYGKFTRRIINERGKKRELCYTRTFPDRAIEHCVMRVVAPILHATIPSCSWAAIKGKGAHHCSAKLHSDLVADPKGTRYCLKMDIHHFFDSIDRHILFSMIKDKIKCGRTLKILHTIIFDAPGSRGLKIGQYSSQILSVFYLSEFIHWMKETVRIKYLYVYMDDIVILSDDKSILHGYRERIGQYLDLFLRLKLKGNHTVFPVEKRRIDFVGYVHNHATVMIRKSTKRKYVRRCANMMRHIKNHIQLTAHDVLSKQSYEGMLTWCSDGKLITKYDGMVDTAITFGVTAWN